MTSWSGQEPFDVRLEWGPPGARALAGAAYAVVVDVLSFSTAVTVACERGAVVHPYAWRDERAREYAAELGAVLAGRRGEPVSLSPAALARLHGVERIVLPSPNGSAISAALAGSGTTVVAACLRNAPAVVSWLSARRGAPVAVIPAGERWSFDTLRPAVEDLWGAGAVVAGLLGVGLSASPEARAAAAAFGAFTGDLRECASGRELRERGFGEDVLMAEEYGVSSVVPVLRDGAFTAAP